MEGAGDHSDGMGTVAVHRWFAGGEGWAVHPWFRPRNRELLRALDKRLKAGAAEIFLVEGLGGLLVGEKASDGQCPDPKARERNPFILRVAWAPSSLSVWECVELLNALRRLNLPDSPGEHISLHIPSKNAGAPPQPPIPAPAALPPSATTAGLWSILFAASTAMATAVALFALPWSVHCAAAILVVVVGGALLFAWREYKQQRPKADKPGKDEAAYPGDKPQSGA